ncbi:AAA family ATPase [Mycoplasmopsis fermentans]
MDECKFINYINVGYDCSKLILIFQSNVSQDNYSNNKDKNSQKEQEKMIQKFRPELVGRFKDISFLDKFNAKQVKALINKKNQRRRNQYLLWKSYFKFIYRY